ncbi:MAG: hypothetical protein KDD60_03305 [Bdellovibrionales bacterium]|nr:hypothetical protein [Bdellovibrionales bacterium]
MFPIRSIDPESSLTLSNTSVLPVTVNLAYSGTATGSGTDYIASGTQVIIPANSTTGSITVTAQDDSIADADETVIVDISSVVNGSEDGV